MWNRNNTNDIAGGTLIQHPHPAKRFSQPERDVLLYFRPRTSWVRPYLSIGPDWVRILSANKPGVRVTVRADLVHKARWGFATRSAK